MNIYMNRYSKIKYHNIKYSNVYTQYNIVFTMKFIIICILFVLSYILQSIYGMIDTALGNAGLNVKPIHNSYFTEVKKIVGTMDKNLRYRNNKEVVDVIKEYANENKHSIKVSYMWDIAYSLYKDKFLTCKRNQFKKYPEFFNKIPKKELQYYKDNLKEIMKMDVNSEKVFSDLNEVIDTDSELNKKLIPYFVTHAQNYLIKKGIIKSMKFNIAKRIQNKLNEFINSKTAEHYKPIEGALGIAGVLWIAGIGGSFYEIGKENAMKNMTKDIKNTHTHTLFSVLLILCSVAATLVLCVTVAYHITKKKQQHNITYTVMGII